MPIHGHQAADWRVDTGTVSCGKFRLHYTVSITGSIQIVDTNPTRWGPDDDREAMLAAARQAIAAAVPGAKL